MPQGDRVRVTLARGELDCEVREAKPTAARSQRGRDMTTPSIKDFEAAIAELESIVKKLEEGDLPLEQSLRSTSAASSCRGSATRGSRRPSGASRSSPNAAS